MITLHNEYLIFKKKLFPLNRLITRINNVTGRGDLIFTGKIVLYEDVDSELNFLPGTSKRLLKDAAKNYGLIPIPGREHEDSIRFQYEAELDMYNDTIVE